MYCAGNTLHGITNAGETPMTFYWSKWDHPRLLGGLNRSRVYPETWIRIAMNASLKGSARSWTS
jgi:hypothetical protein